MDTRDWWLPHTAYNTGFQSGRSYHRGFNLTWEDNYFFFLLQFQARNDIGVCLSWWDTYDIVEGRFGPCFGHTSTLVFAFDLEDDSADQSSLSSRCGWTYNRPHHGLGWRLNLFLANYKGLFWWWIVQLQELASPLLGYSEFGRGSRMWSCLFWLSSGPLWALWPWCLPKSKFCLWESNKPE